MVALEVACDLSLRRHPPLPISVAVGGRCPVGSLAGPNASAGAGPEELMDCWVWDEWDEQAVRLASSNPTQSSCLAEDSLAIQTSHS